MDLLHFQNIIVHHYDSLVHKNYDRKLIIECFNRSYLDVLFSKFSLKQRFACVDLTSISLGWKIHAIKSAIASVDAMLQPEDRIGNPFLIKLLDSVHTINVPTTVKEPEVANPSESADITFSRSAKRKFSTQMNLHIKAGAQLYKWCSIQACEECKCMAMKVPLSKCSVTHVGEPCLPIGYYPHVKAKSFRRVHNLVKSTSNFSVKSNRKPNPMRNVTLPTKQIVGSRAEKSIEMIVDQPSISTQPSIQEQCPKPSQPKSARKSVNEPGSKEVVVSSRNLAPIVHSGTSSMSEQNLSSDVHQAPRCQVITRDSLMRALAAAALPSAMSNALFKYLEREIDAEEAVQINDSTRKRAKKLRR